MKNQFYKLYLIIILVGAMTVWFFSVIFERYVSNASDYQLGVKSIIEYQQSHPDDALLSVSIESLSLPQQLRQQVEQGKIIALENSQHQTYFYLQASEAGKLLQYGPIEYRDKEEFFSDIIVIIFYICLAGLLIFIIRPLFTDLQHLQDKATQFSNNAQPPEIKIGSRSSIYPLAMTFQNMAGKITEFLSTHKYLSRTIAHDIRTPLSRMKFVLEALGEDIPRRYRDRIYQDINEIEALAEDYLNFARMEALPHTYGQTQIDIKPWLESILMRFEVPDATINVCLVCDPVQVYCHPKYLERAVRNLLSNAFKFTRTQVKVSFSISKIGKHLVIEDDGPGLGKDVSHLFNRYQSPDNPSNSNSFGFGLYIAKKVAEWHGGEIIPGSSEPLGGARFEFIWPCYDDA